MPIKKTKLKIKIDFFIIIVLCNGDEIELRVYQQ